MPVIIAGARSAAIESKPGFYDVRYLSQLKTFPINFPSGDMHELMKRTMDENESNVIAVGNTFADSMNVECEYKDPTITSVGFAQSNKMISTSSTLPKDFQLPGTSYVDYSASQFYPKVDSLDFSRKVQFDQSRNQARGKGQRLPNSSKNLLTDDNVQMKDGYKPLYRKYKQKNNYNFNNHHNNGFMPLPPRLYSNKNFHSNHYQGMKSQRGMRFQDRKMLGGEYSAKNGYHSAKNVSEMEHPSHELSSIAGADRVTNERSTMSPGSIRSETSYKYEPNVKHNGPVNQASYSTKYANNRNSFRGSGEGLVSVSYLEEAVLPQEAMLNRLHDSGVPKNYQSSFRYENNGYRSLNRMYRPNISSAQHDNKMSGFNSPVNSPKPLGSDMSWRNPSDGHQNVNYQKNLPTSANIVEEVAHSATVASDEFCLLSAKSNQGSANLSNHEVSFLKDCSVPSSSPSVLSMCHEPTMSAMKTEFPSGKGFVNTVCTAVDSNEIPGGHQSCKDSLKKNFSKRTVSGGFEEGGACEARMLPSTHPKEKPSVFCKEVAEVIHAQNVRADSSESIEELQLTDLSNESLCRTSSSLSSSSGASKASSSRAESLSDAPPPVSMSDGYVCSERPTDISFGIDYNEILEIFSSSANPAFCSTDASISSPVLSSNSDSCCLVDDQVMTPSGNDSPVTSAMEKCIISDFIVIGNKKFRWKDEKPDTSKCNYNEITGFLQKAWNLGDIREFKIE